MNAVFLLALLGAQDPTPSDVHSLIERLGADRIEDRDEAERLLVERGAEIIPALERATTHRDLDLRERAGHLLEMMRIRVRLSAAFRREFPKAELEIRHALKEGQPGWIAFFLEATERNANGTPCHPSLKPGDLNPILELALPEAKGAEERERLCHLASQWDCRISRDVLIRTMRGVEILGALDRLGLWIGRLSGTEDGSDLVSLLGDGDSRVRQAAVYYLRKLPPPDLRSFASLAMTSGQAPAREACLALLREARTVGAIDLAIGRLADPDGRVRSLAVCTLSDLGDSKTSPQIIPLLKDPDQAVRAEAVRALVSLKERGSAKEIARSLASGDETVRLESVHALLVFGAEEAAPEVAALLGDPSLHVHSAAVQFFVRLGLMEIVPRLVPFLKSESSIQRREALDSLRHLNARQAAPQVRALLKDPDPLLREAAIRALREFGDAGAADEVSEVLDDAHPYVRDAAARALGAFGATKFIPRLRQLLRDSELGVVGSAAVALRELNAREAIPDFVHLFRSRDASLRSIGRDGLLALRATEGVPLLVELLESEDAAPRSSVIEVLDRLHAKEAAPALLEKLRTDTRESVVVAAAEALGHLRCEKAVPALLTAIESPHGEVRKSALRALGAIGSKVDLDPVLKALADEDSDVRVFATDTLGRLGGKEVGPRLEKMLKDDTAIVRISAVSALARLKGSEAIPDLIPLLESEGRPVSESVADHLARLGSRMGIETLLQARTPANSRLFALNAIRSPKAWKKLRELPVTGAPGTTAEKTLAALAASHGLMCVDEAERALSQDATVPPCCWGEARVETLLDALEEVVSGGPCDLILEDDRIRIVTRETADRFWRDWAGQK